MIKRILSAVLSVTVIATLILSLFACGNDESTDQAPPATHKHQFAQKWIYDATSHWHPAECEHSSERGSEGPHFYENGVCRVCSRPEDSDGKLTYTVTVTSGDGAPMAGMIVEFVKNGTPVSVTFTDDNGFASAKLDSDTYAVNLKPVGAMEIYYDTEASFVSPDEADLEVKVYYYLSEKVDISLEGGSDDSYAYLVDEGQYRTSFSESEISYFVFTASRSGVFEISFDADTTVEVGYYGISAYVRITDQTEDENRIDRSTILIDVAPSNLALGDERPATPFVIGVKGKLKSGDGVLKITRIGEHQTQIEDLPWHTYGSEVNPEFYAPAEAALPGYTLVDLDITDKDLKIYYNEEDGYYHHMSIDGPIVLMKMDLASDYLDPISAMCGPQHFGTVLYDEDGNFIRKETYHEMVLRYVSASLVSEGGVGVYPLDDHLITMIQNLGKAWGWYDLTANSPTQIFGAEYVNVVPENAWMFALCYAEVLPAVHKVTLNPDAPVENASLIVKNSKGDIVAECTTTADGSAMFELVNTGDLKVFIVGDAVSSFAVNEDGYEIDEIVEIITLLPKE